MPLLDRYLLHQLHRKRSRDSQYAYDFMSPISVDIAGLQANYATPEVPHIHWTRSDERGNYEWGRYAFDSEISSGHRNNDVASGRYYAGRTKEAKEHVIFVHGWRMDGLDRIKELFLPGFMNRGADMYFFTLPYHFERSPEEALYGGEYMVSANIDRTLLAVKQAVSDLRALIRWIKERKGGRVILIGISLGGFVTNLTGVIEERIDLLISVMYANRLAYSVWKTIPGKYIREDLERHGFTYEQLESCWAITDPSRFEPVIPKDRILLLSGRYDRYVLEEDAARLWESWDKPKRIVYASGHAGIVLKRRQIAEDVLSFVSSRLS
ncbi:alpha/beta hydrolase [Paenibacillus chartarius]|uniref:Alpha/beta hydrolase n=1 Tax=Paenibacillus chartarius TaxID=747481 RepID=A0ABV6DMI2_9BACL